MLGKAGQWRYSELFTGSSITHISLTKTSYKDMPRCEEEGGNAILQSSRRQRGRMIWQTELMVTTSSKVKNGAERGA